MPFSPFHLGAGLLFKSALPVRFSLAIFTITQVMIDLEPAIYMVLGKWPIHRFFHTYIGATLVIVVGVVLGRPLAGWLIRLWNSRLSLKQRQWLAIPSAISWQSAVMGAAAGSYSHVFLDSFMHSDIHPYAPFSDRNELLLLISIDLLHTLLLVAGLVGGVVLASRVSFNRG